MIISSSLDEYLLQPTAGRACEGHNQASISPVSRYDMKLDEESRDRAQSYSTLIPDECEWLISRYQLNVVLEKD